MLYGRYACTKLCEISIVRVPNQYEATSTMHLYELKCADTVYRYD